jgi:hypothetical protein
MQPQPMPGPPQPVPMRPPLPPMPLPPMPPPPRPRGWWRRNFWGLLVIPPAIVLALAIPFKEEVYDRWFHLKPTVALTPSADHGWVFYKDTRVRLVETAKVDQLVDRSKKPVTVPGTAWRAKLEYDAPKEDSLGGCHVYLEDTTGKTYGDRPDELGRASVPIGGGCTAPFPAFDAPPSPSPTKGERYRFEDTYFFVLPASARPVAVRVELGTQMPRYVRFNLT